MGGYPGFVSLQVPTSEAAVSADTHAFARLPPAGLRKNRNLRGLPQAPGGPGPKPWGPGPQAPWRPGPQAPGAWIPPLSLISCFNFLLRLKPMGPLTLGGVGWFPKAELYSSMRGGVPVFAPAFQPLGRAPSPWGPGQQASPASRSRIPKMPRCSSAHEKPGLLHRLISCSRRKEGRRLKPMGPGLKTLGRAC